MTWGESAGGISFNVSFLLQTAAHSAVFLKTVVANCLHLRARTVFVAERSQKPTADPEPEDSKRQTSVFRCCCHQTLSSVCEMADLMTHAEDDETLESFKVFFPLKYPCIAPLYDLWKYLD